MNIRIAAAHYLRTSSYEFTRDKAIYEFGVYTGKSISCILSAWQYYGLPEPKQVLGFDSFEGIPSEDLPCSKYNSPEWNSGFCDVRKEFGVATVDEAVASVYNKVGFDNLVLIPGFWDSSLTDENIQRYCPAGLLPCSYCDIDGDLYSSAVLAINFMFDNKLIRQGTLIGFDDWGGTLMNCNEGESGESLAWKETVQKYGVLSREIFRQGDTAPHIEVLFEVLDYEGCLN